MLTFRSVSWGVADRSILVDIDLTVAAGQLLVLVGPSGAGKTSILRLAAGLVRPTGGIVVNGFARTSMVFQEPRLMPWASALDNVALVLETAGQPVPGAVGDPSSAARRAHAGHWLRRLGFSEADLDKRPGQLSGGMQARVAIARAFAVAPDLVLMDEPFAALDLGLRRDLQLLVRDLVSETGAAVLFVTHDLPETVSLADRILVVTDRPGRIVAGLDNQPVTDLADIWTAAAGLTRRRELAPVLAALSMRTTEGVEP
jgi:NitT/TauT family transport system ATP-binding protein